MTRRTLFAATLVLSAVATRAFAADTDATFDKTLSLNGAPTVVISTGSGYVHVNPGPDNQFHIIGHVHGHSGWLATGSENGAARQIAANPPITQSGNTISVGLPRSDSNLYNNVSIDYDVTTPRSTNLAARSGSGSIQIAGIEGPVSADSGSGSLRLALANSTNVKARTGSGSIQIEGLAGGLSASTGSGSIEATGNLTSDWRLTTGSGGIRLKLPNNAHFNFDASTGSGSIHVDQPIVMQGNLNHHHVSGTVNGGGPAIRATTGSGSITINGNGTAADLGDKNSLHVPGATDCVDNPNAPGCRKN
jgi:Putative adhesin